MFVSSRCEPYKTKRLVTFNWYRQEIIQINFRLYRSFMLLGIVAQIPLKHPSKNYRMYRLPRPAYGSAFSGLPNLGSGVSRIMTIN